MPCIFRPSESKETVGVSPPSREKQVQVHGRESTGVLFGKKWQRNLPGELHRRPRTGKAQGLHHYRGLRQLQRLCGSLPPAGHHLGRAQRHPPGALPPLRQLRGALPRGGRYTKGAGDRPSGNLTKGSCGLLAEELSPYLSHLLPCGFSGRSRGILKLAKKSPVSHL